MTTLRGQPGGALRLLVVLACDFGASGGFAAGLHATDHGAFGSAHDALATDIDARVGTVVA